MRRAILSSLYACALPGQPRVSTADLLARLRLVQAEAQQIPQLNSGGCAVYAALVARAVSALGFPVRGRVASWDSSDCDLDEIRLHSSPADMDDWHEAGVWFGHVLCEFEADGISYLHDSEDTRANAYRVGMREWSCNCPLLAGSMSADDLYIIALGARTGWNPAFRRDLYIPKLERIIAAHLA